jgi:hypothetical protein
MITSSSRAAWCAALALTVAGAAAVIAQGRSDALDPGSLAGLTAEIRQLRLAVEESARSQIQTQALGVYLSVQQSRVAQVASRLDVSRRELDGMAVRGRQMAAEMANLENALPQVTDPKQRAEVEQQARVMKLELDSLALQEQQTRNREAELSQTLQLEEARWTEIISRLEPATKRER